MELAEAHPERGSKVVLREVPERDVEDVNEELEIVARIKNNQHRSIRPTTNTGM